MVRLGLEVAGVRVGRCVSVILSAYCWLLFVCGGECGGLRVAEGRWEGGFSINKERDKGRACIGLWRGWEKIDVIRWC